MGYYLFDNPPRRPQFRSQRRHPNPMGAGLAEIHTAETPPDLDPPDHTAENVARFIADRTTAGSYHRVRDSDSVVRMLPFTYEAFGDGTGLNPIACHFSMGTEAHRWGEAPDHDRKLIDGTAQDVAEFFVEYHGSPQAALPHVRYVSRAAAGTGQVSGLIDHGTSDPGRRSDPWTDHPAAEWLRAYLLARIRYHLGEDQEDDMGLTLDQDKALMNVHEAIFGTRNPHAVSLDREQPVDDRSSTDTEVRRRTILDNLAVLHQEVREAIVEGADRVREAVRTDGGATALNAAQSAADDAAKVREILEGGNDGT